MRKWKFSGAILCLLVMVCSLIPQNKVEAKTGNIPHSLTFNNNIKVKTLFYPYRDPSNITSYQAKGLQGITVDENNNFYLTYVTGDKNHYGYIYKYNKNGKLLKKSKRLTIGHGQAISYKNGSIYQLADIRGQSSYTLYKINATTLKVVQKWKIPSTIHPNVIAMLDSKTVMGVSKSGNGYDLNKIHLGKGINATRKWQEKIHINGLIGKTPGKEVQGFAYGKGKFYLLSNGQYMTFKPDGSQIKRVSLNTNREPEGISITNSGRIVIGFNKVNEIFIEQ
ncbi:hypothetical protein ACIQ4I_07935 [Rummeliibacillus sp. NPDC094406]|uniref:hypothetical protein n=1 Tax=Rummeliibacillus sp. NPDC094406 TaxID=3364511 RepID=UPI0038111F4C